MHTMAMQMSCANRQDCLLLVARVKLRGLVIAEYVVVVEQLGNMGKINKSEDNG